MNWIDEIQQTKSQYEWAILQEHAPFGTLAWFANRTLLFTWVQIPNYVYLLITVLIYHSSPLGSALVLGAWYHAAMREENSTVNWDCESKKCTLIHKNESETIDLDKTCSLNFHVSQDKILNRRAVVNFLLYHQYDRKVTLLRYRTKNDDEIAILKKWAQDLCQQSGIKFSIENHIEQG